MYINRKIISEQLIIDLPASMLNTEVDIFIIPKKKEKEHLSLKAKDYAGKLSHLDINDFLENIDNQRLEWQINS